jgi:methanogenic corrinoid protein MtbC1
MTSNSQTPLISQYLERLIALDSDGAVQLIESKATDAASVLDLYFNVLQPAQREIGRLWQVNSISVALEHYATATAQRILHVLSRKVQPARVVTPDFSPCAPKEQESLLTHRRLYPGQVPRT